MDELRGMDRFLKQQFEGGWFELRIVWESLGWCRRRETLGLKFSEKLRGTVVLQSF